MPKVAPNVRMASTPQLDAVSRKAVVEDRRPTPNEVRAINRASNKARTNFVQCSRLVRALYEPKGFHHER